MDLSAPDTTTLLNNIMKNFFLQVPFRCFDEELIEYIIENAEEVFTCTILHEININFPLKKSYQISFLKNFISLLEKNCEEVEESIYHFYLNLVKETDSETHYIHFLLENDRFISILQNTNIISGGTTGLSTWQAGRVLAEYCSENKCLFTGKRILELGCGVGLTGLAVIFSCKPSHYCFSDAHDKVLDYLVNNIKLNMLNKISTGDNCDNIEKSELYFTCNHENTEISVNNFAWENADDSNMCKTLKPDVILAADVVYDSKLFEPFCHALRIFSAQNEEMKIFLSCTIRNASTLDQFFETLKKYKLVENEIEALPTWNSNFKDKCLVKIFSIEPIKTDQQFLNQVKTCLG